jgi:hypothetical protein
MYHDQAICDDQRNISFWEKKHRDVILTCHPWLLAIPAGTTLSVKVAHLLTNPAPRFFGHLRRIVVLFNENERKVWPKWLFRSGFLFATAFYY